MIKRIEALVTTLILLLALLPFGAFANDSSAVKQVRIGYYDLENFMTGATENGAKSGYAYDLLCEIVAYCGWDAELVYGEFGDLINQLETGSIDVLPCTIYSDERAEKFLFSDESINDEYYFVSTLTEKANDISDSVTDLDGETIASVKGAYQNIIFEDWCSRHAISMNMVFSESFEGSWQLVRDGKAGFVLNIDNSAPDSGFTTLFEVGKQKAYFAVTREREDLLEDINSSMTLMKQVSPFLTSHLMEKYLSGTISSYKLTDEEKQWIAEHDILRIGSLTNDVPYSYTNSMGKVIGVFPEITDIILERLGIELRPIWTLYDTIDELHQALKNNEIDLACPEYGNYYMADKNDLNISEAIADVTMGMLSSGYIRSENKGKIAVSGSRLGRYYAAENYPDSAVIYCDSVSECIGMVAEGEAEYAIAHTAALQTYSRETTNIFTITPLNEQCPVCFSARKGNHELISIMNRGLHLIHKSDISAMELNYSQNEENVYNVRNFIKDNLPAFLVSGGLILLLIVFAVERSLTSRKLEKNIKEINNLRLNLEENSRLLEEALHKAEASDRSKTTFLFNMSHDIRTPMNAIIGFTDMAKKHIDDQSRVEDCLNKVQSAGAHLLKLINGVLDMARIESGKVEIHEEPTSLDEMSRTTFSIAQEEGRKKNMEIITECDDFRDIWVYADGLRLDQITLNIVSNAIKYTPDGGSVRISAKSVSASAEGIDWEFTVADSGIGMSPEFTAKIFEPFERAQSSTLSGVEGTGLGMSIVKSLVDMMNGTIDIQSEEGKGTTVTIRFTFRKTEDQRKAGAEEEFDASTLTDKKLLLVEDNELNREIACDILEEVGLKVDTACDGLEAVQKCKEMTEKAESEYYDFILMDIQMPGMDGYTATREICGIFEKKDIRIPIIAMTANAFEEDKRKALEAGMIAHLAKPIDPDKMVRTLVIFGKDTI